MSATVSARSRMMKPTFASPMKKPESRKYVFLALIMK